VKESKKESKTEMCDENLSLAKELKVVNKPNMMVRLKRIYNFLCSMLVFTPFALCFVTLRGVFMRFPKLTY
jgi:hypothetical protein